jgi:hypothetical protein
MSVIVVDVECVGEGMLRFVEPCPSCGDRHEHTFAGTGSTKTRQSHCVSGPKPGYGPPITEYRLRVAIDGVDFVCTYCHSPADTDDSYGTVNSVACQTCGFDSPDPRVMYDTLLGRLERDHMVQLHRDPNSGPLGQQGAGMRVGMAGDFARWPFVLVGMVMDNRPSRLGPEG